MAIENRYDIITRINEYYSKMSKGQKAISAFIYDHYDQAVFMTAAKLGDTVGVSESTVVRYAMFIGYNGYPNFKEIWSTGYRIRSTLSRRSAPSTVRAANRRS